MNKPPQYRIKKQHSITVDLTARDENGYYKSIYNGIKTTIELMPKKPKICDDYE